MHSKNHYTGPMIVPILHPLEPNSWNYLGLPVYTSNWIQVVEQNRNLNRAFRLDASKYPFLRSNVEDNLLASTLQGNITLDVKVLNQTGLHPFNKAVNLRATAYGVGNVTLLLWDSDEPTTSTSVRPFVKGYVRAKNGRAHVCVPRSYKGIIYISGKTMVMISGGLYERITGFTMGSCDMELKIGDFTEGPEGNAEETDTLDITAKGTIFIQIVEETLENWKQFIVNTRDRFSRK